MKIYRIDISSWTASFRYPNIISGFQPTLLVPPVSTVLGIINSCSGCYLDFNGLEMGYYFDYEANATDLETIYQVEKNDAGIVSNKMKSNVINRDFLFNCRLFLYFKTDKYLDYFRNPHYPILLGRSNDLASIDNISELELKEVPNAEKIKGQIVPYENNMLPGIIQALPEYFTDEIPRKNIGTKAFSIIPFSASDFETSIKAYRDTIDNKEIDIYFHKLNFDGNS